MTNAAMKPNRFLRQHAARKFYALVANHLNAGRTVYLCTYTKATKLTAKHLPMLRLTKSDVLIQRGKNWDSVMGCAVRIEA
jgi:hypothetical protein